MGEIVVTEVCSMKYTGQVDDTVSGWIDKHRTTGVLLALDSPLGWPATMGPVLSGHTAGVPTQASEAFLGCDRVGDAAHLLFRRNTDRVIARHVKTPLDIGADKIARVAHATLCLLARLRVATDLEIPLAWSPGEVTGVQAIEVYPGATLPAHERRHQELMLTGYKKSTEIKKRESMVTRIKKVFGSGRNGLKIRFENGTDVETAKTDHALDAVICCLAAADFLEGSVIRPKSLRERTLAEKEGWIWVRAREGK